MKKLADDFCLRLVANRQKLVSGEGQLFVQDLYQLSSLNGWLPGSVISVWVKFLDDESAPSTKFLPTGHYVQLLRTTKKLTEAEKESDWQGVLRGSLKWFNEHETQCIIIPIHLRDHWVCCFVDFLRNYLAIYDSLESRVPDNDWRRSPHVRVFEIIKEWLQRLFLSGNSAIDWHEWDIDPCPKNQPYQINTFDCGVYVCFVMHCLHNRSTIDIKHLNSIITPQEVQKFRFILFRKMMELDKVTIADDDLEDVRSEHILEISRPTTPQKQSSSLIPSLESPLTPIATSEMTPPILLMQSIH
ncbi:hypothetical protein B0H10DRAFT_940322 [Mycena sp. CBHHK59/15]|nr:hypothetical protein B0H10DRAFT_940322 [Mycena sp. CBHHK59/15]